MTIRASVRTKLIALLVLISSLAASLTGYLGYRSGRAALRQSVQERMTAVRNAKAFSIEHYFDLVRSHALAYNRSVFTSRLINDYVRSFRALNELSLTEAEEAALRSFYTDSFLPELARKSGEPMPLERIFPKSPAARYLQHRYMLSRPCTGGEAPPNAPADPTDYGRFHTRYHGITRNLEKLYGYEDILLIDAETAEIVYSIKAGIDLGMSLKDEPYASTGLGRAVRRILDNAKQDHVEFVDFEPYLPEFGQPAAFLVSGAFADDRLTGILAYRFPVNRLYDIISGHGDWGATGLGLTGEVSLVGSDGLLRNDSRFLRQAPEHYPAALESAGHSHEVIQRLKRLGTSLMTVRMPEGLIRKIHERESGTEIGTDYLGHEVVQSYAPLKVSGFQWGIVAKITTDEAFRSVGQYKSDLVWVMSGIGLVTTLIAAFMGSRMATPLRQLRQASRAFSKGFYGVRVRVSSQDEVEDLASTFNEMAGEIELRTEKYREQVESTRILLQQIMPTLATPRFRVMAGVSTDDSLAPDVTLVYSEIEGYDRLFASTETADAMKTIRRLLDEFHAATDRFGIEELSTSGMGYLVACGLIEPHFDHTRRALAFTLELERIVDRFNVSNQTDLYLKSAIHRGPVTFGNLGRHSFIYDVWCKTIAMAHASADSPKGFIRISRPVHDRLVDIDDYNFVPDESFETDHIWILRSAPRAVAPDDRFPTSDRSS